MNSWKENLKRLWKKYTEGLGIFISPQELYIL